MAKFGMADTASGLTQEEARAAAMAGTKACQAVWERVQRVRCRENAPHGRYLFQAVVGGKDKVILDLGPCIHQPE